MIDLRNSLALALSFAVIAACSPQAAESETLAQAVPEVPANHAVSGLEVIPLTITDAKGSVHSFAVEVAASPAEQQQGLMFRAQMGADEGMIFPREDNPRESSFWMRNTVISLDIIFIGTDRRILNIAANAVPYSETPIPSVGVAGAVLELNGGRAAELGIAAGDKVDW